ncbi:unnamed protein product [Moneuplotes crassus]|uniref:Uncharacterized protein n=1 Tax=Euplotes crassus TaxID=5936 RepID=A0AAD1X4D5_EUPCR|nr:unnamed protein product [Moneuplotes crassus]
MSGVKFTFTHLDGRTVEVTSPEEKTIRDGKVMTLIGYGMPKKKANSGRLQTFGNLFIIFRIEWSESVCQQQINGIRNIFRTPTQNISQEANNNTRSTCENAVLEVYSDSQRNPNSREVDSNHSEGSRPRNNQGNFWNRRPGCENQ